MNMLENMLFVGFSQSTVDIHFFLLLLWLLFCFIILIGIDCKVFIVVINGIKLFIEKCG
jgi:hypothetical protein